MKTFGASVTAELASEIAIIFHWVVMEFTSTYRYTNADRPIYSGANKYSMRQFEIESSQYDSMMSVDSFDITLDNTDLAMGSIVLNEEVRNKPFSMGFAAMGSDLQPISFVTLFSGFCGNWELLENACRFTVMNKFALWEKQTLRRAHSSCPWEFKGSECGYSGGQSWCDKTYPRCTALANTSNYGGFRWLPSVMEKQIWWGNTPPDGVS